jgi:hypothetical protein
MLLWNVTFSERGCGMLKNGPRAKHLTVASLWQVFGHKCHTSKKSEGFVFGAMDGRFMAMVKCSAKTRLPFKMEPEFFTAVTHSIRKTFAFLSCG